MAASGVAVGTYNNVTVDTFGRVTGGSNVAYLQAAPSGTPGNVLTEGPSGSPPSFQAPVTATTLSSVYPTSYTFAVGAAAVTVMNLALPSAGTWLLYYNVYLNPAQQASTFNTSLSIGGVAVTGAGRTLVTGSGASVCHISGPGVATIAGPTNVSLIAQQAAGTASTIGPNQTLILAVKLA